MNQRIVPLYPCFRGSRDYVHGTDMYESLAQLVHSELGLGIERFLMGIHRFSSAQPDIHWFEDRDILARPRNATVDFYVSTGNRTAFGWLVESERKVDCRVEYEENTIAEHCTFSNKSASVLRDPGYRPIEIAVSMTKMLHIRFLPSATGRWIFTKLELSRMLEAANAATLRVVLRDKLYGRLTRSEIQAEGGTIGSIYFSLVRA